MNNGLRFILEAVGRRTTGVHGVDYEARSLPRKSLVADRRDRTRKMKCRSLMGAAIL
jgi:hypothetical protein